jgi:hypothetical protein
MATFARFLATTPRAKPVIVPGQGYFSNDFVWLIRISSDGETPEFGTRQVSSNDCQKDLTFVEKKD